MRSTAPEGRSSTKAQLLVNWVGAAVFVNWMGTTPTTLGGVAIASTPAAIVHDRRIESPLNAAPDLAVQRLIRGVRGSGDPKDENGGRSRDRRSVFR